jgi:type I restriction enzyme, S subunit
MRIVELGKVIKIDRTVATEDECRNLPYLGLEHIEKETGHLVDKFVPMPLNMLATNFRFTPKHVLYGKLRPYLNKAILPNFNGVCTTEILPLLPNESEINRVFLWIILISPKFVSWASSQISGANLPRLDPKLLAEYPISLPPLPEQQRIAAILQKADRLRRLRRYARQLSDTYLQSVFLEMFGELSEIKNVLFLEVAAKEKNSFVNGPFGSNLLTTELVSKGIPVVYIRDIRTGYYERVSKVFVTPEKAKELDMCRVDAQDVLIAKVGDPPGLAAIYPESEPPGIVTQDVIRIKINSKLFTPEYIVNFINSEIGRQILRPILIEGTRERFGLTPLKQLLIPIPPLNKQEQFTSVARRFDQLRKQVRESERQAEHLFQSLLQRAFQGEL